MLRKQNQKKFDIFKAYQTLMMVEKKSEIFESLKPCPVAYYLKTSCSATFKACNLGLQQPYFNSTYQCCVRTGTRLGFCLSFWAKKLGSACHAFQKKTRLDSLYLAKKLGSAQLSSAWLAM